MDNWKSEKDLKIEELEQQVISLHHQLDDLKQSTCAEAMIEMMQSLDRLTDENNRLKVISEPYTNQ